MAVCFNMYVRLQSYSVKSYVMMRMIGTTPEVKLSLRAIIYAAHCTEIYYRCRSIC